MNIIYSIKDRDRKRQTHTVKSITKRWLYGFVSEYLVELPIPTTGNILPYVLMAIIGGHNPFLDTPELLYGWLNSHVLYIIITILLDPIQIQRGTSQAPMAGRPGTLVKAARPFGMDSKLRPSLGERSLGRNDVEHIIHIYIYKKNMYIYIYITNISYHYTSYIYIYVCVIVFVNVWHDMVYMYIDHICKTCNMCT